MNWVEKELNTFYSEKWFERERERKERAEKTIKLNSKFKFSLPIEGR